MSINPVIVSDRAHILAHTGTLWESLRGARLFITGGTGFVGAWLLEGLAAANTAYSLGAKAVLVTRSRAAFFERFPHLASESTFEFIEGDVVNVALPNAAFDYVIHAATQRSFEPTPREPVGVIDSDRLVTRRILDLAVASGARRVLFTSSGAVYGRHGSTDGALNESFAGAPDPLHAGSLYGESKRLSELTCASYARVHSLRISIARLFAFAGPYLPLSEGYAVGNFIRDAIAKHTIAIAGDGTAQRSYLYAADLSIWLWTILLRGRPGAAYNVGSPHAVSVLELARLIASLPETPIDVSVGRAATFGAAPSRYVPDVSLAASELGLEARVDLRQSLQRMYTYYRSQRTLA